MEHRVPSQVACWEGKCKTALEVRGGRADLHPSSNQLDEKEIPMKRHPVLFAATALALAASLVPLASTSATSVSSSNLCIVSLSPTATETLFAIGAGKQVEAVDRDANFPTTGLPKKRFDAFSPNAEAIASVCATSKAHRSTKPDLVVVAYDANNIVEQLTTLGINVVTQNAPSNLAGAYSQMTQLGSLTGHATAAAKLVASIKAVDAAAIQQIPKYKGRTLSAYYELDPTLYSLTSSTFVGQILHSFGASNIADAVSEPSDDGYPQLTSEYVVASSPQLVFLADTVCCKANPTSFAKRPGFSTISAAKNHHVVGLNDDVASRWGPRVATLITELAKGVTGTLNDAKVWKK